jgi:branched-chain amino acid transport system substrate-binding protein
MKAKIFLTSVIVCLAISLIAIPSIAGAKPASTKVLKIGVILPLVDIIGAEVKKCFEMLCEQQNKAGGITVKGERYNLEVITYDSKFNPELGRAAAEKLVHQHKVKFIMGEYASIVTLAVAEVTNPAKVLFLNAAGSDRVINPATNYVFRTKANTFWMIAFTYLLAKSLPEGTLETAVVAGYDDEGGHASVGARAKALEAAGVKVQKLFFKRGTTDFGPLTTKVLSLKPDSFSTFGITSAADHLRIMTSIFQSGWRGRWLGDMQTETVLQDLLKAVGKEALEGGLVEVTDAAAVPSPSPDVVKFQKDYKAKYGEWRHEGLAWCPEWYFLMQAIKAADSLDPDDILAVMTPDLNLYWPWAGHCIPVKRPDRNVNWYRDVAYGGYLGVVRDGEMVFTEKISAETVIEVAEKIYGVSFR